MESHESDRNRIPTGQWWVIAISLAVPGMALVGLVYLFQLNVLLGGHAARWAAWGLVGAFVLLLVGCCTFAAGVLTCGAPPNRRLLLWAEETVRFLLLQVFLAPAVAGLVLLPFIV